MMGAELLAVGENTKPWSVSGLPPSVTTSADGSARRGHVCDGQVRDRGGVPELRKIVMPSPVVRDREVSPGVSVEVGLNHGDRMTRSGHADVDEAAKFPNPSP